MLASGGVYSNGPAKQLDFQEPYLRVVLGFIGVKLIIEALHGSHLDAVGSFRLPEIGTVTSLLFIVATLTITTVLSLVKTNRDARRTAEAE